MARHVWLTEKFTENLVEVALATVRATLARGLDREGAARFTGYYLETMRQAGLKGTYDLLDNVGKPTFSYRNELGRMLTRCDATGHRYAKGRNRDHYLEATRRVLAQAAGLNMATTPLDVTYDKLAEMELLPVT